MPRPKSRNSFRVGPCLGRNFNFSFGPVRAPGQNIYFTSDGMAETTAMRTRTGFGPEKPDPCRPLIRLNTIALEWCTRLNWNLVWIFQVPIGRTLLILVNDGCIVFFYRSTKKHSHTLRLVETSSLNGSSIQTVHSIEFKYGMHVIDYRPAYCFNFSELRINSFFTG